MDEWGRSHFFLFSVVDNPTTRKIWMDRNLGVTRAATRYNDPASYGDLYQWGRSTDGYEKPNPTSITTRSSTDQPAHGSLIKGNTDCRNPSNNNLWQGVNGINYPCPSGYRLPIEAEWNAEFRTWATKDDFGAFRSPLKLPVAGLRDYFTGNLMNQGAAGYYWSSTLGTSPSVSRVLSFSQSAPRIDHGPRSEGFSVRCIKH